MNKKDNKGNLITAVAVVLVLFGVLGETYVAEAFKILCPPEAIQP